MSGGVMPAVLLVPGTQATELVDASGEVVYSASGLSMLSALAPLLAARVGRHTPREWAALLELAHEPGDLQPQPHSLKLFPGRVLRTPYEPLYHTYGDDFADWPYDWRLDILSNGRRLMEHLRTHPSSAHNGRWRVVGHSQGGLVILAAAAVAGPAAFADVVSHAALVGAPLAGTFRAAEALLFGREDFGADAALVDMLRDAARSWPALIQMLPGWNAVVKGPHGDSDADAVAAHLQLRHPQGWPADAPLTSAQAALLPREEVFHDILLSTLTDLADARRADLADPNHADTGTGPGAVGTDAGTSHVRLRIIMGLEQETTLFIRRGHGGLAPGLEGQPTEPGDDLVPALRTVQWAGGRIDGPVEFVRPNLPHAMLLKDPEVIRSLAGFFEEGTS